MIPSVRPHFNGPNNKGEDLMRTRFNLFAKAFVVICTSISAVYAECRSQSGTTDTGIALSSEEMSFTVGQSCPLNPNLIRSPTLACSVTKVATGCTQSTFLGVNNCCTTGSKGGTFGCTGLATLTTTTGRSKNQEEPIQCSLQIIQNCQCSWGTCSQNLTQGNPCGTRTASSPSC